MIAATYAYIVTNFPFLWQGLVVTLQVSALVVAFSLAGGLALGVAIVYGPRILYWPIRAYSDVIRSIPLLVLIFFVYYGLPALQVQISAFWAAVLALSLFKTGHVIETVRGAIGSIPPGQNEAGKAIGLGFGQRLVYVIFPQALRRFLPPWLNAVTDTVKGSALVSLLGVVDLMQSIQQVIGRTYEPLPMYLYGAAIYFVINYTLSSLSRALEARFAYIRE
ncbi:MAG: amino acid ABC transporter permease [Alphaproteobacteria bacterium]|nr:amino acid ABC transporter permease [Alphaproteobacteria bacterium]